MVGVVFFWLLDVGGRGCSLSFFIAGFELFYWFLLQVDSLNSPILFICLTSKPSLSFVRQTCSFVRQTRSTLLHVSFFRSSDALFRSSDVFFPLADAFYSTACVVLSFVRRVLSFGRRVLLYCMCRSFVRQTRSTLLHVSFFRSSESISFPSIASDFSSVSSFFAAVLISCLSGSSFFVVVASACLPFGFWRLSVKKWA